MARQNNVGGGGERPGECVGRLCVGENRRGVSGEACPSSFTPISRRPPTRQRGLPPPHTGLNVHRV